MRKQESTRTEGPEPNPHYKVIGRGEPVAHVASLAMGEKFIVQMQDGKMDAIAGGNAGGHSSETSKRARKSGSQGDLF